MNTIKTFLIIDDDDDDRELFQLALKDADDKTICIGVNSGIEAIRKLCNQEINPNYIFLDLNMPQMSGKECLIELKKLKSIAHIPVIIFSTSSDPKDIEETRKLGSLDFITKPSKISELTTILKQYISLP